jgi:hypothetical protein
VYEVSPCVESIVKYGFVAVIYWNVTLLVGEKVGVLVCDLHANSVGDVIGGMDASFKILTQRGV